MFLEHSPGQIMIRQKFGNKPAKRHISSTISKSESIIKGSGTLLPPILIYKVSHDTPNICISLQEIIWLKHIANRYTIHKYFLVLNITYLAAAAFNESRTVIIL